MKTKQISLFAAVLTLAMAAVAVCPSADLTDDCFVDMADFVIVSRWWLSDCDASNAFCDGADFDLSGQVTTDNLLNVASLWLERQQLSDGCPSADLTGDCYVDLADFVIVSKWWLSDCNASNAFCDGADFDASGQVTLGNLLHVASLWLEGQRPGVPEMTWVSINDPGVAGHEGFNGQMSKFQTTNAQYAQFLNAALETGDIVVDDNYVKGAAGSNHAAGHVDERYYRLDGPGESVDGAEHGGKSRILYSGNSFSVAAGFENHPATYVSGYGASAFAGYYGWRLPTEWEWLAVADFDGSYIYGCGLTIDNSMANYRGSDHPHGTTEVGVFGAYGYGMADMAGNAWEWTSTLSGRYRILRGGSWNYTDLSSKLSARLGLYPYNMYHYSGFRVCR